MTSHENSDRDNGAKMLTNYLNYMQNKFCTCV